MKNYSRIYGVPGERARVSGLLRAALPLGAVLVLCGYSIGAFVPWSNDLALPLKGLIVLILAVAIYFTTAMTQHRVQAYFKGALGEEQIAVVLATLPVDYTVVHGVVLGKGGVWKGFNFDHVVVGPTGIHLIETKNWQGNVALSAGRLTVDNMAPTRSPLDQVRSEAQLLADWLARHLAEVGEIHPVVCFTGSALESEYMHVGEVTLCRADHLVKMITQKGASSMDLETRSNVIKLLSQQV